MALPTSYLTSVKNVPAIFEAIQQAKAPERFTVRFLESLDFKNTPDRLIVGTLKALRFLDDQGKPTARYFAYLDRGQSRAVMAEAIREAYKDLFDVNTAAQKLTKIEVSNKFKTLTQGQYSEAVIEKMASTFIHLCKLADFNASSRQNNLDDAAEEDDIVEDSEENLDSSQEKISTRSVRSRLPHLAVNGLHYNIQIILPESRDPAVYDALFRSLREHLG